jgi:hypothetical protein
VYFYLFVFFKMTTANVLHHGDILLQVFDTLDIKDLVNCARVCKTWNAVYKDKRLWEGTPRGKIKQNAIEINEARIQRKREVDEFIKVCPKLQFNLEKGSKQNDIN